MIEHPATTQTAASVAEIATDHAKRYLSQLCKHFQHRRPVMFDRQAGQIEFAIGTCKLRAEPGRLVLQADASDAPSLAQLEDIVARHLVRFAFREDLHVNWQAA